jgi:hypothetical protein
MNKRSSIIAAIILSACWLARADWYSATITVTNTAGTINGQTLTVNSDVRTWTNSVSVPASQILTNNTRSGAAANLLNQVAVYPFVGMQIMTAPYGFTIRSNAAFTVTLSSGWGAVTATSITTTSSIIVELPLSNYSIEQQTNIASALAAAINSSFNTNPITTVITAEQVTNALPPVLTNSITGNSGTVTTVTPGQVTNALPPVLTNSITGNSGTVTAVTPAQITNALPAVLTNSTTGNSGGLNAAAGQSSAADLTITNRVLYGTNAFAGPTNNLDMAKTYQFYSTWTPCSITGFSNTTTGGHATTVLRIMNLAATNITVSWPVPVSTTDGSRSATCTNGQWRVVTFSGVGGIITNASTASLW